MKCKTLFFVIVSIACAFVSCGTKEKNANEETIESVTDEGEWEALDKFHAIMADVYHPLKDSGNLQPIKERSKEFAEEADGLANSDLPDKVSTDEVKAMISALQESAHGIDDAIRVGSPDEEIGALLEAVHTLFHTIQEQWYAGAVEGHEEHH